jgi:hypothetical protein
MCMCMGMCEITRIYSAFVHARLLGCPTSSMTSLRARACADLREHRGSSMDACTGIRYAHAHVRTLAHTRAHLRMFEISWIIIVQ